MRGGVGRGVSGIVSMSGMVGMEVDVVVVAVGGTGRGIGRMRIGGMMIGMSGGMVGGGGDMMSMIGGGEERLSCKDLRL